MCKSKNVEKKRLERTVLDCSKEPSIPSKEYSLILEANSLLRSAYSIALRKGTETNWEYFTKALEDILNQQHKYIYPTANDFWKE